jgi:CRP/FNR family transcriptional regulator
VVSRRICFCLSRVLASQLGTVRELISRNLMRLQAEALLDVDARQIVVKNKAGLSALLTAAS